MPRKRPLLKLKYGRIAILAVLLISFIVLGAGIGFVAGALRNMPKYDLNNITGDLSSFVLDKDDQVVTSLKSAKNRVQLEQNEIPEVVKKAVVAIEDQRFYRHHGVDLYRLAGAVVANITKGYGSQGASTITQQLVKMAILENSEKKLRRKIQEAVLAVRLESMYSKEQILTLYLNNIYYGHGAWSLQTAAQVYFGKDARDLNLDEAAMLAGVINLPGRYSPYLNMEKAKQRQALVLNEMVKMNYISKEEAEQAKERPLTLVGLKSNNYKFQSFVDYVIEEAAARLELDSSDITNLYTAGFRFYTTMDTKTQEAAEEVYADEKNFPAGKKDEIVQSAMVVLNPHTGEVVALMGGRNQQGERQFNRAVDATRQPGSAFKPVAVYGPALEKGYSPATVLDDTLQEYDTPAGSKTFVNYDSRYRGLISMRTGIQYSINTVAVKMLEKIGVTEGFNFAKNLGISTLVESGKANDMGLSLALGGLTKGVSPLELAAAYGAFDNQGVYVEPYVIRKIEDRDGNVLYQHKPVKRVVMSPQTAYLMTDMLRTVVEAGTATKARLTDRPVAGKTGTTSFDVDAWFVGYTPDLVGAVWIGYDQKEAMYNQYGGSVGGPIWKKVMTVAHQDLPASSFPVPEGIATIPVDYKSGLLPSSLTPPEYVVTEKFNSNYLPTEVSNVWVQLPVCAETGQLLTENCPTAVTGVFLKRPVPWTGNTPPEDANLEPPSDYCALHGGGAPSTSTGGFRLQGYPLNGSSPSQQVVKLSWHYPGDNQVNTFRIYRSTQPNVAQTQENFVGEVNTLASEWQDNHVEANTRYYYVVVAMNTLTGTAFSSNVISVQPGNQSNVNQSNTGALKAPRLSGEAYINGQGVSVNLSWSKAAENRPMIYYVFRSETPGFAPSAANQIAVDETIAGTSWVDSGLSRHKTYYYRIVGFDAETNQQSPASNQLTVQIN